MILRMLTSVTPWLLAGLLGIAVFAGMQARHSATERDAAVERADRADQRAAAMGRVMDWQRIQLRSLATALADREQQLADDDRAIDQRRESARSLERDDDATADWADRPVPGAARAWMRGLGAPAGADDPDAGGSAVSAQAAAGAATPSDP